MAGKAQSEKDKAMAARLKADKVVRKVARCPICNKMIALKSFYQHIATCR